MTLVECVSNFSQGRRPEVIVAIVAAIAAGAGAQVPAARVFDLLTSR